MSGLITQYRRRLWQQKGLAILGVVLAVLTAFSGIALLAVSGWFISATALAGVSITAAHAFNFFTPGAAVRGLSIGRTAGRYGERIVTHEVTFRLLSYIRSDMFRALASRRWSEDKFNRHEVASRMLADIRYVEAIYLNAAVPALTAWLVAMLYLMILAWVHSLLLMLASGFVLVMLLGLPWWYMQTVLAPQDQLHQHRSQLWSHASGILHSLRTLTLFGQFKNHCDVLIDQAEQTDQLEGQAVARQQGVLLIAQLILALLVMIMFWQVLVLYGQALLQPAQLFMLFLLTLGTTETLLSAVPAVANFFLGLRALQRLDRLSDHPAIADMRSFNSTDRPSVQLHDVSYCYPAQQRLVLDRLNYTFQPGWHWLVGESGVGKSTLIRVLAGDISPIKGQICFSGPVGQLAVMPQHIGILRAPLRQNIALHRKIDDQQIWDILHQVKLSEWARTLPDGLDTWLGEGEWQPSGGEAKRLGLARLLVGQADTILLDEPFAGLDTVLISTLIPHLRHAWRDCVVVAVSHDHQFISKEDQVLALTGEA